MDIIGTQGLGWAGDHFSDRELMTTREWLRSKGNSIEGGTSEVQLNIVSKRVLKLLINHLGNFLTKQLNL